MQRIEFDLSITLCSPFLFPTAGVAGFGTDAVAMRDAEGRAVLPADQLRGVLLEAMRDLAAAAPKVVTADMLARLCGASSADAREAREHEPDDFVPNRGHLLASDLVASDTAAAPCTAVRIRIDQETGAVAAGALMTVELVAPPGQLVTFEGSLVVLAPRGQEVATGKALAAALRLVGAIGAQKSVGFGCVVGAPTVTCRGARSLRTLPSAGTAPPVPVCLRMHFDRPFLVDANREAGNLFIGSEQVPGAVVKGALARRLELAGEDVRHGRFAALLTGMRISHAVPENEDGVPTGEALPLSVVAINVAAGELRVGDSLTFESAAHHAEPAAFSGAMLEGLPGRFAPDWKPGWEEGVRRRLGLPDHASPGRHVRVHTAIDDDTGIAATGKLFVAVARSHRHKCARTGAATGPARTWRLTLSPAKNTDAALWNTLIGVLLSEGLDGIGRTGAHAGFERLVQQPGFLAAKPVAGHPDTYAVVLQTPAVMMDARPWPSARAAYTEYWASLPGFESVVLLDHVANQHLAGGYLARRFRPYGKNYVPFVLTKAGATFLLKGANAAALDSLMQTGLPVAQFNGRRPDWRVCPFVPENGFGAFRADHLAVDQGLDRVTHV